MKDKWRVLIIDDEEDVCKFSKSILERTGNFDCSFSTTPIGGVNLVKDYKPDLILLDIFMPEMDGSDLAEQLLSEPDTRNIPIVFLTALAKDYEVEKMSGKIGGRFFIPKPVSPQELVGRVESILKK